MRVLILSGGGAGLFAYGGAFEALKAADHLPDKIAGTSAGAFAGALLAAGRVDRIAAHAETTSSETLWGNDGPFDWLRRLKRLSKTRGLLNPQNLYALVHAELNDKVLAAIPAGAFESYAVDVLTGEHVRVYSGESISLRDAVLGSMALPVILPPYVMQARHGGRWELRDGGIVHNHPVLTAVVQHRAHLRRLDDEPGYHDTFECIVLSALDPYPVGALPEGIGGALAELDRVIALMLHQQARWARETLERHKVPFRWIVVPTEINLLDFSPADAQRVYDAGRVAVTEALLVKNS